jgi:RNAse (barnase) inhibitor barstar
MGSSHGVGQCPSANGEVSHCFRHRKTEKENPFVSVWYNMTQQEFQEILSLFQEAEEEIKKAEMEGGAEDGLSIPAVNEFRYAFHHVMQFLQNHKNDDFVESKAHLIRVICDALEMRILLNLERIKNYRKRYWMVGLSSVVPNWIDLYMDLETAKESLAVKEASVQRKDKLRSIANRTKHILNVFRAAEEELNRKLLGRIGAFIGSFVLVLAGFATIYGVFLK